MKKEDGLTPGLKESKSRLKMSDSQCLGLNGKERQRRSLEAKGRLCFEEEGGFSSVICC